MIHANDPNSMMTIFLKNKPKLLALGVFTIFLLSLTIYHRQSYNQDNIFDNSNIEAISYIESTSFQPFNNDEEVVPNEDDTSDFEALLSDATSGRVFNGSSIRVFPSHLRKFDQQSTIHLSQKKTKSSWNCQKWAVVTTIFEPQEAARRFLYRKDWCLVVVGDLGKPKVIYFTFHSLFHQI